MNDAEHVAKAKLLRRVCLEAVARTNSSHIGGVLSMMDVAVFLFYEVMNIHDRFVLSKGHAALGLYAILLDRGYVSREEFESYHHNGSRLIGHASHMVPGVDVSTGSLGHGPAIAAGMALGHKMNGEPTRVYCMLGDGECQEGAVWEALAFISRSRLDNLTVLIDANGWQGFSDPTPSLLPEETLIGMLVGSGLEVIETDGHDFGAMRAALSGQTRGARIVFAHTVKGRGVSFMEDAFEWHYRSPTPEQLERALAELE